MRAPKQTPPYAPQVSAWKKGFIASPGYDLFFFILSPLMALTMILSLDTTSAGWGMQNTTLFGAEAPLLRFFIGSWTFAHLFAVVFRSHGNPKVFRLFWPRFVIVPIVLLLIFSSAQWARGIGAVTVVLWDVYHTSMQNFGFCRIYDSKQGNPPEKGRGLDIWMNHLVYIAPIFVGLSLRTHLQQINKPRAFGLDMSETFQNLLSAQNAITTGIVIIGTVFVTYYIYAYWRMSQDGYRVSPQKIVLLISTAVGSIWAWAFLPPFKAYFAANFFHGLQYFGIVWWTERGTLTKILRLPQVAWGYAAALACFVMVTASAGVWYRVAGKASILAISIALVISLMHFWYDGFIWSVRKRQV